MDDPRTPEAWFRSLPPLTRFLAVASFVVTLLCSLSLASPYRFMLDWRKVGKNFQVWRLLSDYLFSGLFSFGWLMHMYFLVTFSAKLETKEMFNTSPGAYFYFLVFQCVSLDLLSLLLFWPSGRPMLAQALIMAIIYYWSRKEPFGQCGLWGFQIPAYQFPFALLFLDLLMGNNLMIGLMGLSSGHFYYFLKDVLPAERNIDLLRTTPYVFDEIMRRAALIDPGNLLQSFKYLLMGKPAEVRIRRGVIQRGPTDPPTLQSNPMPRLFAGAGHRLGATGLGSTAPVRRRGRDGETGHDGETSD